MKRRAYQLLFIISLLSNSVLAQWEMVGNANYNWGPFDVYTMGLYTENGEYSEGDRPLLLSFKYNKPIEGRSFAITLIKEIKSLGYKEDFDKRLKQLQNIFPDFSPNDVLNYIALKDKGYFILNDSILNLEFETSFNQAFLGIWLSQNSHFSKIRTQLIGKEKNTHSNQENLFYDPEIKQLNEEDNAPQLPPNFQFENKDQDYS
ncbi:chalcone isomerase-like protein [Bisgaardia hudsonensis]|uniref:Chalcone isomerase-like protein n=1 Tax=Bisgaardia hudsonensis TaxID=109472 RepID=A0A4R2N3H2_9PAST|nr:chalcone isomerase family protein [Bisgaardia hudsonensis]QLB12827.1 hypothetical protein A6A11_04000 [Bisgaardia hudsonensis]TCP14385.1 chalcone isomerase-like protein [Bisgaardia hudsonensis]